MKSNYRNIVIVLIILCAVFILGYYLILKRSSYNNDQSFRDMNSVNQNKILAQLKENANSKEGKLIYDIERSSLVNMSHDERISILNTYLVDYNSAQVELKGIKGTINNRDLKTYGDALDSKLPIDDRANVLKAYGEATLVDGPKANNSIARYNQDMNIFGIVYLSGLSGYSINVSRGYSLQTASKYFTPIFKYEITDKGLARKVILANMLTLSDMASEVKSPEVANDKAFVSSRLALNSHILLSFIDMLSESDRNKFVSKIKDDLSRLDLVNRSIFAQKNSKFNISPLLSETIAYVALANSGDKKYVSSIDKPYKFLATSKNDDKTSVNSTLFMMNMYRYYYYSALASSSQEGNSIISDMYIQAMYNDDTKNLAKRLLAGPAVYDVIWNIAAAHIREDMNSVTGIKKIYTDLGVTSL